MTRYFVIWTMYVDTAPEALDVLEEHGEIVGMPKVRRHGGEDRIGGSAEVEPSNQPEKNESCLSGSSATASYYLTLHSAHNKFSSACRSI